MLVYIVRHGIAINREDPDAPPEAERFLTSRGVEKTREAARGFRQVEANPEAVLSSPYLRALQTAEIFCSALGIANTKIRKTDALKPEAAPKLLVEELSHMRALEVICFGHAPHLDELIAYATHAPKPFTELKKAGAACLDLQSFSPVDGKLSWLLNARTLRDLA